MLAMYHKNINAFFSAGVRGMPPSSMLLIIHDRFVQEVNKSFIQICVQAQVSGKCPIIRRQY